MRTILLCIIAIACISMCSRSRAEDTSIPIDTSPAAVEAAYQAVRTGDAQHVVSLKDTAETMLVKLINAATVTGEFIADQVPIVIKELIRYKTALYTAGLVVGFILIALALYLRKVLWDKYIASDERDEGWAVGAFFGCSIPSVLGGGYIIANVPDLLMITLAPRVWLIEYAAALVK